MSKQMTAQQEAAMWAACPNNPYPIKREAKRESVQQIGQAYLDARRDMRKAGVL